MNEKPHFDRAIVCLHATIRYNILDYMDDTSHFNKAIVRLHNMIPIIKYIIHMFKSTYRGIFVFSTVLI